MLVLQYHKAGQLWDPPLTKRSGAECLLENSRAVTFPLTRRCSPETPGLPGFDGPEDKSSRDKDKGCRHCRRPAHTNRVDQWQTYCRADTGDDETHHVVSCCKEDVSWRSCEKIGDH